MPSQLVDPGPAHRRWNLIPSLQDRSALRIAGIYCCASLLWILVSDELVQWLVQGEDQLTLIQSTKGFLYVFLSTLLIWGLVRGAQARVGAAETRVADSARRHVAFVGQIAQLIPDPIVVVDRAARVLDVIGGDEREFVAPRAQVIGKHVRALLPPAAADQVDDALARTLASGEMITTEFNLETMAGRRRFEARSLPVNLESDEVGGLFIARDITAADPDSAAQREQEARLRALVNASMNGILFHDGRAILDANPRLAKMFGYDSPVEMIGQFPGAFIAPKWRELAQHRLDVQSDETAMMEGVRKDGSIFPIELSPRSVLYRDRQTRVIEVRDLTAQRAVEAKVREGLIATVEVLAKALEIRDPYTAGHERRVADIAVAIGTELNLPDDRLLGLRLGSLVHDLGKIRVPTAILNRPGRLSPEEMAVVKMHPATGHELLEGVELPWPVADIVRHHHERLDGSGYPDGLKGDQMSLDARIVAVADVVESMVSHRPYRPGLGIEPAMAEIAKNRGTKYDPLVVDICTHLVR